MRTFLRKFLVVAAAYAVALQPIVAGMSAAHARAAAELCASGQRTEAPVPADRHGDDDCCLAMGCNASAGAAPVGSAISSPPIAVVDARLALGAFAIPARWPNERPHSARAPPA